MTDSKTIRLEKALLVLWLLATLAIGALTVHAYGISIDEPNNYFYAADTLRAYPSLFGMLYEPHYNSSYDGHGPAFVAIAAILIRIVQVIFPNIFAPDLWHFSYFVTFQLTGLCLYWLAKRWFSTWTALGILILFSTQPLLLGHAFINPKDIPFMFFLTLSIVLGFRLVDRVSEKEPFVSLAEPAATLQRTFQEADPQRRKRFLRYLTLALAIFFAAVVFSNEINSLIERVILSFYTAEPGSWAGRMFDSLASQASNVAAQDYVSKALRLFHRVELGILFAALLLFLSYFGLLVGNTTLPVFLRDVWMRRHTLGEAMTGVARSVRRSLHWRGLKSWLREIFLALRDPYVISAGVALGLATAVRAIAPFAGVIVILYLLSKVRSRVWTMAIAYFLVAGIVTYLAWPRLWDAPLTRYLEGLGVISNFSNFPGRILFNGQFYGPGELPRSYLPILLNIQFTEPVVLSLYLGLGILAWRLLRSRLRTDLLLYIGLGFAFPLFGLMALTPPLYHNFRQALFMIPAMFMLAAFTLDWAFSKLTYTWLRVLLIAVLALPGVYSSIKLYPYEYVYYNSLVDGLAGARNRYELDYWRISLREVALELNELAPPGAIIVVTRSAGLYVEYSRPDLVIDKIVESTLDLSQGYDYVVQVARWDAWDLHPDEQNIVVVERDGVVLATAKDVQNANEK